VRRGWKGCVSAQVQRKLSLGRGEGSHATALRSVRTESALGGGVRDDIVVDVDEDILRAFVVELIDTHIADRPRLDCTRGARGDECAAITFTWERGRSWGTCLQKCQ